MTFAGVTKEKDQFALQNIKDFYITHIKDNNLENLFQLTQGSNLKISQETIEGITMVELISRNANVVFEEILAKRKEQNPDITLSDITYESLDRSSKQKLTAVLSFHGEFLFSTGFVYDDFFKNYFQEMTDKDVQQGQQFFNILDQQLNKYFEVGQTLTEGATVNIRTGK